MLPLCLVITGPPAHSVGGSWLVVTVAGVCHRRLLGSVTLHGEPAGSFTRAGKAMMSCRLHSYYISTAALHGGPVVLRAVRATPCCQFVSFLQSLLAVPKLDSAM